MNLFQICGDAAPPSLCRSSDAAAREAPAHTRRRPTSGPDIVCRFEIVYISTKQERTTGESGFVAGWSI
jgi:hypothetical protein